MGSAPQIDPDENPSERRERFLAFYRNALEATNSIEWDSIVREEGGMPASDPYDYEDDEDDEDEPGAVEVLIPEVVEPGEAVHLVLSIEPESVEPILEAWDHWQDHRCPVGRHTVDAVFELVMMALVDKMGRS